MADPILMPRPGGGPDLALAVQGRRVLVVEDDYVLAKDLQHELEDAGAEVLGPVPSVADALALLATDARPGAAVPDVNLGGEWVFPMAEALRERGVPFLFATGYDRWSLPATYAEVPHCEKPFDVGRCLRTWIREGANVVANGQKRWPADGAHLP